VHLLGTEPVLEAAVEGVESGLVEGIDPMLSISGRRSAG
jgi:hypothetical protein